MKDGGGLILTRKLGDSVALDGGRILVTLVRIKGKQVRLRFECDKSIKIDRIDKDGNVERRN